jgi:GT2 family glycosyltransferase
MKVSIVIPNYNTQSILEKNLSFVLKAAANPNNHIREVILVDDASPDGSATLVKKMFPEIKLIRHKVNRGFSASVNTGVRAAKGELICLLNTDVIPSESFLVAALPHFESPKVFAVSLNEGGYSWARGFFKDGYIGHEPGPKDENAHETFWVNGGSGVFKRSIWMVLGGMDEKLLSPFYWEDLDLCYRAAKRGYQIIWEPGARVEHKHETTISLLPKNRVMRIRERNHLLFIWKDLTSPRLFRKHIAGLIKRTARHPGYVRIVLMAVKYLRPLIRARAKEKKETKISDEAIFARF